MFKYLMVVVALLFTATMPTLADEAIYTGFLSDKAVGGYDTVAYFTEGKPVKGSKKFKTEYMDAEWRFSSQENLDAFLADPAKYAPQYGGYCSWAMAGGFKAPGSPKYWKIVDNKLYLNYDQDIYDKWEQDIPGFIKSADEKYPEVVGLDEEE